MARKRAAESECEHVSHRNPALLIPCPECGEEWKFVLVSEKRLRELQHEIDELRQLKPS